MFQIAVSSYWTGLCNPGVGVAMEVYKGVGVTLEVRLHLFRISPLGRGSAGWSVASHRWVENHRYGFPLERNGVTLEVRLHLF